MSSIQYEKYTVAKMIQLYCRKRHAAQTGELCQSCASIHDYAMRKLEYCPFGDDKGACKDCAIHCYHKEQRELMRQIMRYSGPRMLLYHPVDFIIHYIQDKGRVGIKKRRNAEP